MKWFRMTDNMKLASLWAVWTFLAVGAVGWALFVVLDAFGAIDQAAAWVQAIGSVVAVLVAVAVAYHAQQQAQDLRASADAERDFAHAARLHMLIWEAAQATVQFRSRAQQNQLHEELLEVFASAEPLDWQQPAQSPLVLVRDVSFYQRIMQRAMHNLDDDLNAKRHIIAGKFRFNLSVLITFLEKSVDQVTAVELIDQLESAHKGFKEDLAKLAEHCPRLVELDVKR
ncbi:hypothetical protein [Stutzerimonas nitrititolerans]|uniref:hypothetical protein n=1 Tax=Stutzerimonas nitrititolerans TaxID=2482751 RepID=UPI0014828DD0|nr:hypothetical protein [Stutzerimonas nitrititolerans]NNT92328.1 hypothetical protein [Stutzerimonas nitrititolerans]